MSELQIAPDFSAHDHELSGLIAKTAQGDEAALGALYDQTCSHTYGLALRVLDDPTLAEEVTLDVYMQVWRQASQFDQHRGKPIVWLTVLARSRAIDRLRVGQKEREYRESLDRVNEPATPQEDPEASSVYSERCRFVQQALASLAPEQRKVVEMAYFWGLSQSEIATQLGEPLGTVKTRIRLGMKKLRTILGPCEEGLVS